MGVPGLFSFLSRRYGDVFRILGRDRGNLDLQGVYLDGNGLLYPIANMVKKADDIARTLLEAVQEYADVFRCPCHLYIDGPAHMGKMRQQRLRRFMYDPVTMVQDRTGDMIPWSPAMFTPGTKMMQDIDTYVQANRISYPGLGVYSSYAEAGEGEHKIIRDLRSLAKSSHDRPRVAIVGKDADLLLLGMSLTPAEGYNLSLYILRHDDRTNVDAYKAIDPMNVIECAQLRQVILGHESQSSIWSFIVATFLIGNDFLPPVPEFSLIRESLPLILSLHPILADRNGIKWDAIIPFLKAYSSIMDQHRDAIYGPWYQSDDAKVVPSIQTFEDLYYFNMTPFKPDLNALVRTWVSTIQWNYLYYRDGLGGASTAWQYPTHFAPSLNTLLRLIPGSSQDIDDGVKPGPASLTPLQALSGVLPIWLHDLLPKDIALSLKDHPEYYPYAFKRQPPTGDPIIPIIPHSLLISLGVQDEQAPVIHVDVARPVPRIVDLEHYYARWLKSEALNTINLLQGRRVGQRATYELENIVERWLLSNASDTGDAFQSTSKNDDAFVQEWNQTLSKYRISEPSGQQLLTRMKMVLTSELLEPLKHETKITNTSIFYGRFHMDIHPDRLRILISLAKGPEPVLAMAMNYGALRPRGQHWGLSLATYVEAVKQGLKVEGFASPLNSQIIMARDRLGLPQEPSFCSLFPETDAIFGSLGSFFELNLEGIYATVNPPFILDIMNRAVDKCIKAIHENERCKFTLYLPSWKDAHFYQALDALVQSCPLGASCSRQDLIAGQYEIEDIMAAKPMKGLFNSNIWTLTKGQW